MAGTIRCKQGHENQTGYNFCTTCGERLEGGQIKCPACGAANDSGASFCGKCGASLIGEKPPDIAGMRWQRGMDDFATRVEAEDLKGILVKGLLVEQGTKALLFVNGALAEILQPGRYDLGGLAGKLRNFDPIRTATAILVDAGDMEFNFDLTGVYTKDPLNIDINCKVITQIQDPVLFFNNIMKGRGSYLISDLRSSLYDEIRNAFNEVIGRKSVADLNWDLSLKRQFEVAVENHLRTTFQRTGLTFIQLRTIDYRFKGYDKIRNIHEEVYLLVTEEEAKLQGRKRLFDVFSQGQMQEFFEETWKTDLNEKWTDLRNRMEKNLNLEQMNKIRNKDEMENFIHEMDKGKNLRAEEMEVLLRTYEENKEDHEIARQFMLKKLDLEHELDYERLRLLGKEGLEKELLQAQIERKRKALEADLEEIKLKNAHARLEQIENAQTELKIQIEGAKTKAEIDEIERKQDKLDLELGFWALEQTKGIKRRDEYERLKMKWEDQEKEIGLRIKEQEALHKQKLEWIAALSNASAEAIISVSDTEKAQMIAELKRTETLKDFSEDQILAMAASNSPEVAKAFQEKFKGLSSEELKKLYERMIADKDKTHADHTKMMQEMFNKMAETQRDTAIGVAQGGRNPNVVYPPPGQPGFVSGFGGGVVGGEVVVCSKCKARVSIIPGLKFCNNCGNELF